MPNPLKTGETVVISYNRKDVIGHVTFASANGRSVMLDFEARMGSYVGLMPVSWDDDANGFVCLVERKPVGIKRLS